jgi:signal transduction histidine kinase
MYVRKSVLLVGAFAALLLVVAVSATVYWQSTVRAQRTTAALRDSSLVAGEALSTIRYNVYLAGILIRDYLLDPDPRGSGKYTAQFKDITASTEESFKKLESAPQDEAQRRTLRNLRVQLDAYWDPTEIALDWSSDERQARRTRLLRQKVKKRQEIFSLADEVQGLVAANVARERKRVSDAEASLNKVFGWTTAIAILFGAAIAVLTLKQLFSLERESSASQERLRQLSAELRTAQENERKYLSRELHDQIGQLLTGLKMELTGLARRTRHTDPELLSGIETAKGHVEQIVGSVRNIAMLLRPSMLDDLGLGPALVWQAKEFSRVSNIQTTCELDPAIDSLPESLSTCLYRVVQEALTNCVKHSHASAISVVVRREGDEIVARVSDDGIGFKNKAAKGLGLIGIAERIEQLKGRVKLQSEPGKGTTLEARLPLSQGRTEKDAESHHRGRSRDRAGRPQATA